MNVDATNRVEVTPVPTELNAMLNWSEMKLTQTNLPPVFNQFVDQVTEY